MSMIDQQGRVFGRVNLVDAAIVAVLLGLIPLGYAAFLLFRPERPVIESVTNVEIGDEERRVTMGTMLTAKLKVKGHGFNPLLRARIDAMDAVGLVYENPNSMDVIVGVIPPGKHDLVLFDGVQEVARAAGAVEVSGAKGPSIRIYGWFTNLDQAAADALKTGTSGTGAAAFQIVSLGPVQPAYVRASAQGSVADLPLAGKRERAAEVLVNCDWPSTLVCAVNGQRLNQPLPAFIGLGSGALFEVGEIAAPDDPQPAVARIRVESPSGLKAGDRDATVGDRAAEVVSVDGNVVTIRLGVNGSREGWQYRGELVVPGSTLTLHAAGRVTTGTVIDARLATP